MSIERIIDSTEPLLPGMVKLRPILERFVLSDEAIQEIRSEIEHPGFGVFSDIIIARTYSRFKSNGEKESFKDIVVRNVEGILSMRKNHYVLHGIYWDDEYWSMIGVKMGKAMVRKTFLPPGRGLFIAGSDFSYNRGGAAFNNCGFISTKDSMIDAAVWMMDSLMCGCGIGFDTKYVDNNTIHNPLINYNTMKEWKPEDLETIEYVVHDSREGWVKSLFLLMDSYFNKTGEKKKIVTFDYSHIRQKGAPLSGFGGESSGYKPLEQLHIRVRAFFNCYIKCKTYIFQDEKDNILHTYYAIMDLCREVGEEYHIETLMEMKDKYVKYLEDQSKGNSNDYVKTYDITRLIVDIFNSIGCCVVAGNIRRSSEIALGNARDTVFTDLKNYAKNPERGSIAWMSNNSVIMESTEDFDAIPNIAERIKDNGEPGVINNVNTKFGRIGKRHPIGREKEDGKEIGINPCLTADTLILTENGEVPISELVGVQFNAKFPNNEMVFPSTEEGFWSTGVKKIFKITLEDGKEIKATENHKFALKLKEPTYEWYQVFELKVGAPIVLGDCNSFSPIVSIEECGTEEVFDCTIESCHCFSANGILSHNCGEIPLESYEYCNLAEVFLPNCKSEEEEEEAIKLACVYAGTVSLIPTHWSQSNSVIARNRKQGISLSGIADYLDKYGFTQLTKRIRHLYTIVRYENERLSTEACVPASIRTTTVKPSGTISLVAGVSAGIHFPTFRFAYRRVRISADSDIVKILQDAGIHSEPDVYSGSGTLVFRFPINQGKTRPAQDVSIQEQVRLLELFQREWADNSVSVTLYFNPETESHLIEGIISQSMPVVKSLSCLPHTDTGVYAQAPYEKISEELYNEELDKIGPIDWSRLNRLQEEPEMPKGCDGGMCVLSDRKKKKMDSPR